MSLKSNLQSLLRTFKLLGGLNTVREKWDTIKNRDDNRKTQLLYPNEAFPPPSLLFETFAKTNWRQYFESGAEAAAVFASLIKQFHIPSEEELRIKCIAEWGCGVGRIIRHLPQYFPEADIIGTDINREMIAWNKAHISRISFIQNRLEPPLGIGEKMLDAVIAASVFTHLSEEMQHAWAAEVWNCLKPGGVFIFTVHGVYHAATRLNDLEKRELQKKGIVVRKSVEEGSKWYAAFHNSEYIQKRLFSSFTIHQHIEGERQQDIWVVGKLLNQ